MRKLLNVIFVILAILFVVIFLWRYAPVDLKKQAQTAHGGDSSVSVSGQAATFWDYFNQAEKARKNRSFQQAVALYEKAHEANPQHQSTLYYLGQMHLHLHHFKQARTYWQKLAQLDPTSVQAQKQLGTLYFCQDSENRLYDLKQAQKHYLHVLELNRIETYTHLQLGKIALLNNNLNKASSYFSTVINHDFMNYQALFLRGYVRYKQNHREPGNIYLARADSVFQNLNNVTMHGEGATETGFKPMLAEEQFCDALGPTIDSLVSRHLNDQDQAKNNNAVYQSFDSVMSELR